jgi:hypothetical protein
MQQRVVGWSQGIGGEGVAAYLSSVMQKHQLEEGTTDGGSHCLFYRCCFGSGNLSRKYSRLVGATGGCDYQSSLACV